MRLGNVRFGSLSKAAMRTPSFHIANGSLRTPVQFAAGIVEVADAGNEPSIFGVSVPQIAPLNRCVLFRIAAAHPSRKEGAHKQNRWPCRLTGFALAVAGRSLTVLGCWRKCVAGSGAAPEVVGQSSGAHPRDAGKHLCSSCSLCPCGNYLVQAADTIAVRGGLRTS
jgi:hypothetical protein